ncbi:MAG: TraR/DksA family transcriptional regulator [Candidatus Kaiserbacteria bacterium]|nr:TraR/DksA family transcriptional regulator [Candidatus Kaiserbacteria bacterium]
MKDTHVYKTALEEMLKNITEELKTIGIHNPNNPSDWIAVPEDLDTEEPDLNLAADSVEEWNERTAIVATLETRYNGIQSALARIETGTFGICEVCKNEIEEKRLAVSPTARTCMVHLEEENSLS